MLNRPYECELHGAAETCSCSRFVVGPAVASTARQREVGLGLIGHDLVRISYGQCSEDGEEDVEIVELVGNGNSKTPPLTLWTLIMKAYFESRSSGAHDGRR